MITLGANPIRVIISGSAPGPQGLQGTSLTGLGVDGNGDLVGELSNGTTTAPIVLPAGAPGVGIASVAMGAGDLVITLTNGQQLPPIDLSSLFAGSLFLTGDDGTGLVTQSGDFIGGIVAALIGAA